MQLGFLKKPYDFGFLVLEAELALSHVSEERIFKALLRPLALMTVGCREGDGSQRLLRH